MLEARDRIGGRVFTDKTCMGVPVELGAELVHGDAQSNSLWPTINARRIVTPAIENVVARRGNESPWASVGSEAYYAFPKGRPPRPESFEVISRHESALRYLRRLGVSDDNHPLALLEAGTDMEQLYKTSAVDIRPWIESLWDAELAAYIENVETKNYKVVGGYSQVIESIASGVDVRLGHAVQAISQTAGKVTATAQTSDGLVKVEASHCIVAVPAPVLLAGVIAFSPPLPARFISDLSEGESLPVAKVLLEFSRPVLPPGMSELSDFSALPGTLWNGSLGAPGYEGQVVVGWATGDRARELLAMSSEAVYATTLKMIQSISMDAPKAWKAATMHDWTRDPFSLGAYGNWEESPSFREPFGRVEWAGMIQPQVDLAHDSGIAAAERLGA